MSKLKILVTGANGFVGSHFIERAGGYKLLTPEIGELDLTDFKAVKRYIKKHSPDWIVNFAAYTDVTKAEEEKGKTDGVVWKSNVEAVDNLLKSFSKQKLIQISTDMVFPGSEERPGPYKESDVPGESPDELTWYGWTKNRGEKLVREAGGVVVRIIYPVSIEFDKRLDFIKNPVKRFAMGKMYPLFEDQQVSVSFVEEISEVLLEIIDKDLRGVFHVSSDTTTPYDLIKEALESMGEDSSGIKSASVLEFLKTQPNKARYPVFGGLSTKETQKRLGRRFMSWKEIVEKMPKKAVGPRRYKGLPIANTVVISQAKYPSKEGGFLSEVVDFSELSYYLGFKFEPRSTYLVASPEGVLRGGHLESRSKVATVTKGKVYYGLVDTREGETFGRVFQVYLGEGDECLGRTILIPEGVIDFWVPVEGEAVVMNIANKPFNFFDTRLTLDVKDKELGLKLPSKTKQSSQEDEDTKILKFKKFVKCMSEQ